MPLKFKIAGNTLVQLVGKLITAGITFLITFIIAREYGAVGYGEFTKIIAFVSLFYLIVDFGLNAVRLKETYDEKETETDKKLFRFIPEGV